MTFSTRITVRSYELDALGHVNHAVYHQYAEVARGDAFEAAGCAWDSLFESRTGPVLLESHITFRRELRKGDIVDVSCSAKFGTGKTFQLRQQITKLDGTVAAEITSTVGLMDLDARRLLPDPAAVLERAGVNLAMLTGQQPPDGLSSELI
ncbi:MAG TPA: acyl-CoA thioesterase [Actinophytocola sp.]|uniref:acyl-CoA thioesterase n=1 Tax=Actinophytocola sp. TaxID=1872138 RepID=UPI002DDD9994|nr:acyl-CoA thioesterase [Actinophytocola sp.]HEV2778677.1 acyl-CoA thioesterase [Actinophytocola sp.]